MGWVDSDIHRGGAKRLEIDGLMRSAHPASLEKSRRLSDFTI
jgi:hypothetical protein